MALAPDRSPKAILDELARHPRGDALARLVHALAWSAFAERRGALAEGLDEAARRLEVDEVSAETSYGNVLRALRKASGTTSAERVLLGALVARGVALLPPGDEASTARTAEALAWLGATAPLDPLSALDDALGPRADAHWRALGELVRRCDDGATSLDRGAAVVACASLAAARSEVAREVREVLCTTLRDPLLLLLVQPRGPASPTGSVTLAGEQVPAPRHPVLTALLTVSLVLPLWAAVRGFARFALQLRRPADITITHDGVRVRSRVELLGRTLRDRETFLPREGLVLAAREVRWPSLALYVGLAALTLGSFVGLRLFVDGLRSRSPEFLVLGAFFVVVGLSLDYVLAQRPSTSPERCGLLLRPRRGPAVVLRGVDRAIVDAALARLSA
jgi:hypothetical protein